MRNPLLFLRCARHTLQDASNNPRFRMPRSRLRCTEHRENCSTGSGRPRRGAGPESKRSSLLVLPSRRGQAATNHEQATRSWPWRSEQEFLDPNPMDLSVHPFRGSELRALPYRKIRTKISTRWSSNERVSPHKRKVG